MFKLRNPVPGESPGTLRPREQAVARKPVITLIEYDRTHLLGVAIFQIVYFKKRGWL